MVSEGQRRSWAEDGELATEIELYGDLVVAASESESELTMPQIDRVLGVDGAEASDGDQEGSKDEAASAEEAAPPSAASG